MTDTTEAPADTPADDLRARNKTAVFAALAATGISRVTVEYDGCGDSGQIENVDAWNASNEKIPFPTDPKIRLASDIPDRPFVEISLETAVEELAWDHLEEMFPGWEIDDGALGTFVFDVAGHAITLEHRARFTDVDISTHQF